MRGINLPAIIVGLLTVFVAGADEPAKGQSGLLGVPFHEVEIHDAFWSPRLKTNRLVTLEACLTQSEKQGNIRNFAIAAGREKRKHSGLVYHDSDLYKVLQGAAYTLREVRSPAVEERIDKIIELIAAAQQPDGYVHTYYTVHEPGKRWTNIAHGHEMYCAGHLIEAAIAYRQATGKRLFLDTAIRFADHICSTFGPGKRPDPCGHQEIELALVKLWRATDNRKYLDQARFFLEARGKGTDGRKLYGDYAQDHIPVRSQREVVGHAVRAMYQYCAMADVAAATGEKDYLHALTSIWHDIVDRKMYITGGIGPSAKNEGFTVPYDLPNDTAYAETCAALGMALWNHRMFLMTCDGKYADVLEREVYNGMLSGVSLAGDRFFYTNPLGSTGKHHRVSWFSCPCCPTNLVRYLPAMGERLYAHRGDDLWTVLYCGSTAIVPLHSGKVKIDQESKYPWEGLIELKLTPEKPMTFTLHCRVPGWCHELPEVAINGEKQREVIIDQSHVTVKREWKSGDVVRLTLPMTPQRVYADPKVKANVGRVALMRGPIVYCLEGVDHPDGRVRNIVLPPSAKLHAEFDPNLLGGVTVITGEALAVVDDPGGTKPMSIKAVPYSTWDNRAPGEMVVWLPESKELVEGRKKTSTK
jgi:uncharacterized protein